MPRRAFKHLAASGNASSERHVAERVGRIAEEHPRRVRESTSRGKKSMSRLVPRIEWKLHINCPPPARDRIYVAVHAYPTLASLLLLAIGHPYKMRTLIEKK